MASSQEEHRQIFPQPGWVEHDPEEIIDQVRRVIEEALRKAELGGSDLSAVGITNQRETTVIWERNRSTCSQCHRLAGHPHRRAMSELGGERAGSFSGETGLPLATYFSGPKVAWLLEHDGDCEPVRRMGNSASGRSTRGSSGT